MLTSKQHSETHMENESNCTSTTWATGRMLTGAQRSRKRQKDRFNQLKKRRANSVLVESLQHQVNCLSSQLSNLSNTLPVEWTKQYSRGDTTSNSYAHISPISSAKFDPPGVVAQQMACTITSPNLLSLFNSTPPAHQCIETSLGLTFSSESQSSYDAQSSNQQSDIDVQGNIIQPLFNDLIEEACLAPRQSICSDELLNQDALIRGVTHGWGAVTSLAQYCPLWAIISRMDQLVFCYSSTITRFCTLRMIHYMLLTFTGVIGAQELPAWYRPRPSQKRFFHEKSVDILPWPGLRERAVLDHNITKSDLFWRGIIQLFEFNWPHSTEEAFCLNRNLGLYSFTGLYEQQVREIRMWNMNLSFFNSYPDLFDDIVPATTIPMYNLQLEAAPHMYLFRNASEQHLTWDDEDNHVNLPERICKPSNRL